MEPILFTSITTSHHRRHGDDAIRGMVHYHVDQQTCPDWFGDGRRSHVAEKWTWLGGRGELEAALRYDYGDRKGPWHVLRRKVVGVPLEDVYRSAGALVTELARDPGAEWLWKRSRYEHRRSMEYYWPDTLFSGT